MYTSPDIQRLKEELKNYSREDLIWFNGFVSGLIENTFDSSIINEKIKDISLNISTKPTILYATETGNSKKAASKLNAFLKKNKIQPNLVDIAKYSFENILKDEYVFLIISTQGDGEVPLNALDFYTKLKNSDQNLSKLNFAIFALGDISYPLFCKAGEDFDLLFKEKGAKEIVPIIKNDVDFQDELEQWFYTIFNYLKNNNNSLTKSEIKPKVITSEKSKHRQIYQGKIIDKILLNDRESNKKTFHIEILPSTQVNYLPGDAIGFYPKNNIEEVKKIALFFDEPNRFEELLNKNINGLTKNTIEKFSSLFGIELLAEKIDLVDIIESLHNKTNVRFDDVIKTLNNISPRLYSISSSPSYHVSEIHITVNRCEFFAENKYKLGLCSNYLSEFEIDDEIEFYIHKNSNFRLPQNDESIIMIGPGTGIAPFRSFLYERDALGSQAKNWLFFGEQHFVCDFYYQTEIQEWLFSNVLDRLDTAFSRDQKNKIYVQNRIKENALEFIKWLNEGAYLYICGQKFPMSVDVENTIIEILITYKNYTPKKAKNYLDELEEAGRYIKDVY